MRLGSDYVDVPIDLPLMDICVVVPPLEFSEPEQVVDDMLAQCISYYFILLERDKRLMQV